MPEGHTIHRFARDHRRWFAGERVTVSSPQGRFERGAALVDGLVLERTDAYGKNLFHSYEGGHTVHIHLGLFGRFFTHEVPAPAPRATVRYRVEGPTQVIDLVGATTCQLLGADEVEAVLAKLGPDPIRRNADPDRAWRSLQRRRIPIGQALMDQSVLAGVGNVYRAEVLFVHGVHPELPANQLPRPTWESIWSTLVTWLRRGVREQRIITVDPDELGKPRRSITREEATYVYKQPLCRRCGTEIRRFDLAGRWAYACERCQPRPRTSR